MDRAALDPAAVLAAFDLEGGRAEAIEAGHINRTWRVAHPRGAFILQWLNPIFAPELHLDIEAITARLEQVGMTTPRLVPTVAGELWHEDAATGVWRLFTLVAGETLLSADAPERCRAAGRLLGAFHRALWEHEHVFHFTRSGVHDTARHLRGLLRALEVHRAHPRFTAVQPLAAEILERAALLDLAQDLPRRLVHGDPKISNFIFSPGGQAICLVDLDTLARMPIAVELGDAFRSWCNPRGEAEAADFEVDFFRAGLRGYAETMGDLPGPAERAAIPAQIEIICVELAARFCADALEERYFNWDRRKYGSASEHNERRAGAQLCLARSVAAQRRELEAAVAKAWR